MTTPAGALWSRWTTTVTVGEMIGFSLPAVTAVAVRDAPGPVAFCALLAAGAGEAAVLGAAQARVLRTVLTGLSGRRWTLATVAGGVTAWAIGSAAPVVGARADALGPVLTGTLFGAGAVALLLAMGIAQWTVLRRAVDGAWRWIPATIAGWAVGLGVFAAVTTPLWHPGQDAALVLAIGVFGGVLMAASMAAVTGVFVVRLAGSARRKHGSGPARTIADPAGTFGTAPDRVPGETITP
ncbi:hypothetical protein ACWEQ0_06960 [Nocardia thailandica]